MQRHPLIGEEIIRDIEFLAPARAVVRHHHERWDGGGYPDGLAGEEIPLAARVFALADALDAITSDRPYRAARSARGRARASCARARASSTRRCSTAFDAIPDERIDDDPRHARPERIGGGRRGRRPGPSVCSVGIASDLPVEIGQPRRTGNEPQEAADGATRGFGIRSRTWAPCAAPSS